MRAEPPAAPRGPPPRNALLEGDDSFAQEARPTPPRLESWAWPVRAPPLFFDFEIKRLFSGGSTRLPEWAYENLLESLLREIQLIWSCASEAAPILFDFDPSPRVGRNGSAAFRSLGCISIGCISLHTVARITAQVKKKNGKENENKHVALSCARVPPAGGGGGGRRRRGGGGGGGGRRRTMGHPADRRAQRPPL